MRIAASRNSGSASFSRNPLAPCRIARAAASSRSNVVSITTRGGSCVAQQLGGGLEAVHDRHPDVHQHDVGSTRRARRRALRARRMPRPRPPGRAASRSACGCRRGTAPGRRRARRGSGWPTVMPRTPIGSVADTTNSPSSVGGVRAGRRRGWRARPCRSARDPTPPADRRVCRPLRTSSATRSACHASDTATGPPSPWRRAFVSASCRMRYTASCTAAGGSPAGAGSTSTRSSTPAARTWA